ncbi:hypothetical protein ANPL_02800 [Anaplasma platys]|uniref:Uncharacterized protein n=1 Tax=Anaplasma platys TaxID=949 RepID=A0A858PYE4_9RICK|nr:hypothetical protein [Anaplasma platys]QJC27621.1 hypothetical protein ANPL_02800 [Anaplasma platys]
MNGLEEDRGGRATPRAEQKKTKAKVSTGVKELPQRVENAEGQVENQNVVVNNHNNVDVGAQLATDRPESTPSTSKGDIGNASELVTGRLLRKEDATRSFSSDAISYYSVGDDLSEGEYEDCEEKTGETAFSELGGGANHADEVAERNNGLQSASEGRLRSNNLQNTPENTASKGDISHETSNVSVLFQDVYKRLRAEEGKCISDFQKAIVRDGSVISSDVHESGSVNTSKVAGEVIRGAYSAIFSAVSDVRHADRSSGGIATCALEQFDASVLSSGNICEVIKQGVNLLRISLDLRFSMVRNNKCVLEEKVRKLESDITSAKSGIKAVKKEKTTKSTEATHAKLKESLKKFEELRGFYKGHLGILEKEMGSLEQESSIMHRMREEAEKYDFLARFYHGNVRFRVLFSEVLSCFRERISELREVLQHEKTPSGESVLHRLGEHQGLFEKSLVLILAREEEINDQIRNIESAVTEQFTSACSVYSLGSSCYEAAREEDKCFVMQDVSGLQDVRGKLIVLMRDLYKEEVEYDHHSKQSRAKTKSSLEELYKLTSCNDIRDDIANSIRGMEQFLSSPELAKVIAQRDAGLAGKTNAQRVLMLESDVQRFAAVLSVTIKNYLEVNELLSGCLLAARREEKISKLSDVSSLREVLGIDVCEDFAGSGSILHVVEQHGLPVKDHVSRIAENKEELAACARDILSTTLNLIAANRITGVEACHIVNYPNASAKFAKSHGESSIHLEAAMRENAKAKKKYFKLITRVISTMAKDEKARGDRIAKILYTCAAVALFIGVSAFASYCTYIFLPIYGMGLWFVPHAAAVIATGALVVCVSVINYAVKQEQEVVDEKIVETKETVDARKEGRILGSGKDGSQVGEDPSLMQEQTTQEGNVVVPGAGSAAAGDATNSLGAAGSEGTAAAMEIPRGPSNVSGASIALSSSTSDASVNTTRTEQLLSASEVSEKPSGNVEKVTADLGVKTPVITLSHCS